MGHSTLDHLRRQIRLRLKRNGATQKQLAEALGHSGQWLSMILREKRGIKISEIDKIAAFLHVTPPAALFQDPDQDPSLLGEAPGEAAPHGDSSAQSRGSSSAWEIIARQQQTIGRLRRTIDFAVASFNPAVRALQCLEPVESDCYEDRRAPFRRGEDRPRRARSATGNRR